MRRISIVLFTLLLFSGCSIIKENDESFKLKYFHSTFTTNFSDLTKNLVNQLCGTIKELNNTRVLTPLYVVDFVNLKNLKNDSELGFMLSDELKTHVTQKCDMPVYSLEYSKYIKIGQDGTKLLSRDINELHYNKINKNTYALVGTYTTTQRQLILYLKLIDLRNGIIVKSATTRKTLTDEIMNLDKRKKPPVVDPDSIYQPIVL